MKHDERSSTNTNITVEATRINQQNSNLLTEAEKNKSILNSLKETLLPLITSEDTRALIESVRSESRILLEQRDQKISVLTEELDNQVKELTSITEHLEKITEENEIMLNEEREKRLVLEDKLITVETKAYAYDRIRENFRLRNYSEKLLCCRSMSEVDLLVETILSVVKSNPSAVINEKTSAKSLVIPETVEQYLKVEGKKVDNSEDSEELTDEELEEAKLAGI